MKCPNSVQNNKQALVDKPIFPVRINEGRKRARQNGIRFGRKTPLIRLSVRRCALRVSSRFQRVAAITAPLGQGF